MIKLVIAINGDNEDLAREDLIEAIEAIGRHKVYRAWTEAKVDYQAVDDRIDSAPKELKSGG